MATEWDKIRQCALCGRPTVFLRPCPICHRRICPRCFKGGVRFACPDDFPRLPTADQDALKDLLQQEKRLVPIMLASLAFPVIMIFSLLSYNITQNGTWGVFLWIFFLLTIPIALFAYWFVIHVDTMGGNILRRTFPDAYTSLEQSRRTIKRPIKDLLTCLIIIVLSLFFSMLGPVLASIEISLLLSALFDTFNVGLFFQIWIIGWAIFLGPSTILFYCCSTQTKIFATLYESYAIAAIAVLALAIVISILDGYAISFLIYLPILGWFIGQIFWVQRLRRARP